MVCHLLIVEKLQRHGCSYQIVTDDATELTAKTLEGPLKAFNIEHIRTTPYIPTSNGLVEKYNWTIKNVIAKYARDSPQAWDLYVN